MVRPKLCSCKEWRAENNPFLSAFTCLCTCSCGNIIGLCDVHARATCEPKCCQDVTHSIVAFLCLFVPCKGLHPYRLPHTHLRYDHPYETDNRSVEKSKEQKQNMSLAQPHGGKKLAWPSALKTALKMHLKAVQSDGIMPLIEENPANSVLTIITKVAEAIAKEKPAAAPPVAVKVEGSSSKKNASSAATAAPPAPAVARQPTSPETVSTLADFLLDLFEQCCLCNLLTVEERRTFQFIVLGKQAGAAGRQQKKRRVEDVSLTPLRQRLTYSPVLTVEYLLRLLAALPILVHHYRVLCAGPVAAKGGGGGGGGGTDGCEELWYFAGAILRYLEQHPTTLTPLSKYAPFVEE